MIARSLALGLTLVALAPLDVAARTAMAGGTASVADADDCVDLGPLLAEKPSEMTPVIQRFDEDRGSILRKYAVDLSPRRDERLRVFLDGWLAALDVVDVPSLSPAAQADWLLLRNLVRRERRELEIDATTFAESAPLLPFAGDITALAETREAQPPYPPSKAAEDLVRVATSAKDAEIALRDAIDRNDPEHPRPSAALCRRTVLFLEELRRELRAWQGFRAGYDPDFSWWIGEPYRAADSALDAYARTLRERGIGQTPDRPDLIVGTPIGRDALLADLESEMIPYTPEELVAIGEREYAWCEAELKKAAAEMGFGDDWRAALERVKTAYVEPGDQPALIRELADEAVAFLVANDLVTVPPLAVETWRMEMMSPERQMVTPFFTGGEVISVSFPTAGMTHEDKLMSMRGNNRHFSRATVHHELIPGHRLQQWAEARHRPYRHPFRTPFWTEGWALHWEMLFWDRAFARTPEERIGMLFWRIHRAARIIFSLKYHLGQMTSDECVDFLVEKVGHERANAEGEVRRSVSGDYAPLYQAAYMIGGLQMRALHRDLVGSGRMTERQFHDAVLAENNIPIEVLRVILRGEPVTKDWKPSWRFDDPTLGAPPTR